MINLMKTNRFFSYHALLLMCITAFLAMQWTSTHIHLAEQHTHEGSYHQHQVVAHAHHLTNHHASVIDSFQQTSHASVIELDDEYSLQKRNQQNDFSTVRTASFFQPPQRILPTSIKIPVLNTKLNHLDRSTLNPRAPPKTA